MWAKGTTAHCMQLSGRTVHIRSPCYSTMALTSTSETRMLSGPWIWHVQVKGFSSCQLRFKVQLHYWSNIILCVEVVPSAYRSPLFVPSFTQKFVPLVSSSDQKCDWTGQTEAAASPPSALCSHTIFRANTGRQRLAHVQRNTDVIPSVHKIHLTEPEQQVSFMYITMLKVCATLQIYFVFIAPCFQINKQMFTSDKDKLSKCKVQFATYPDACSSL